MMLRLIKISLFVLLTNTVSGQLPAWWNVNIPQVNPMLINVLPTGGDFTFDGVAISNGSYIGAFVDTVGSSNPVCIGNVAYQGATTDLDIYEPPANSVGNIYFLYWDFDLACTAFDVTTDIPGFGYMHNPGSYTMNSLIAVSSVFTYDDLNLCANTESPTPSITGNPFDVTYLGDLPVDSITGELNLSGATPGVYVMSITTQACVENSVVDIIVLSPEDCPGFPPVISPYSSTENQSYYFSEPGTVQIYDKTGRVVRTLTGPQSWDGTDDSGQLLPADEYYAQPTTGTPFSITIIK